MRIFLFHKGGIGDIVFVVPLIRDLRQAYPGAEITALTHEKGKEILRFCSHLTEVLSVSPSDVAWSLHDAKKILIGRRFDIAITTARSLRAAYLLSLIGAKARVGFVGYPERVFFTHAAKIWPFEVVFARRYQRLAEALGVPIGDAIPRLTIPNEQLESARSRLSAKGWDTQSPLIGLHIGGGWPTKKWPVKNILALIRAAHGRHGAQFLLQGGAEDLTRAKEIVRQVSPRVAIDSTGNRISHAMAEAALCRVVVGIDSGLSHAAAACGVPMIYLFGPNDERSVTPTTADLHVLTRDLPCRPCNRAGRYRCPEGHHRCMRDLDAINVLELISRLYLGPRR
jgi:heptosyltransferase II